MKRVLVIILVFAALVIAMTSCSPAPEPVWGVSVENISRHVCAWRIYKTSDPAPEAVRLVENKGSEIVTLEPDTEYTVDCYMLDEEHGIVDGPRILSEYGILDSKNLRFTTTTHYCLLSLELSGSDLSCKFMQYD